MAGKSRKNRSLNAILSSKSQNDEINDLVKTTFSSINMSSEQQATNAM